MPSVRGRGRVLGLLWLVGAVLTVAVIVLPYPDRGDVELRAVVVAIATVLGALLVLGPEPPEWILHAILVFGVGVITFCTSIGTPDVEAVFFLLPVAYAFATFPPARALPHLGMVALGLAIVTAGPGGDSSAAPALVFTLNLGVAGVLGTTIGLLLQARERAVLAGVRNRRIAETLQRTLLPDELPAPDGVALAARYVAAAEESDVGGDVYDAFDLGDGRLLVAIGDVAGKGLVAAVTVGQVRSALRAYALENPSPAALLRRVDRLLRVQTPGSPMVTLAVALADPAQGTLTYSLAGHPPPLVLPHEGKPFYLPRAEGQPLGVLPDVSFAEVSVPFAAGDRLLLFSDGLIERRGPDLTGALRRLSAVAADTTGADELIDAALGAFDLPARDDVALLALALDPPGTAARHRGHAAQLRPGLAQQT